jgi:beta-phosphoglucomutase
VATAAPPANRELVLDGLDLRRRFRAIIGAEHAARGKPFPDIYLAAAAKLDRDPALCIAFEDAVNGVRSARAAGMRVVGVVTTTPVESLIAAGCEWVMPDFTDPPGGLLEAFGA